MDQDSQVMNACRRIVQLVYRRGYRPLEKLPAQNELVELTGFCNNTLTPAIKLLAEAGFLEKTHKVGRVLLNRSAWPDQLWRIVIPYGPPDDKPGCQFAAVQLSFLLSCLQAEGCVCLCLPRLPQFTGCDSHELEHFVRLAASVSEKRVDGIITSARFAPHAIKECSSCGIPVFHIGNGEEFPLRIELDVPGVVDAAMLRFQRSGIRRPLLVESSESAAGKSVSAVRRRFLELAQAYEMELDEKSVFAGSVVSLLERADEAASGPEHDGILILNDVAASAYSMSLALAGRRPLLAVQTNRQLSLAYALPVIRYEFDVEALASTAVKLLLETILAGTQHSVRIQPFQEKETK